MKMSRAARIQALVLALALTLGGCATTSPRLSTAMQELDAVWTAENSATRARRGQEVVAATPEQAARAARQALAKLGMTIAPESSLSVVTGSRMYPNPGYSWTAAVRAEEEPRLRRIFAQSVGPLAGLITTRTTDETLVALVSMTPSGTGRTSVVADFRADAPAEDCSKGCVEAMPPAAYRQAQDAFWPAFRLELASVIAANRAKLPTRASAPKRKDDARGSTRKPASGWKTPPKKK